MPLAGVDAAVPACTMQCLVHASLRTLSSSPLWSQHSCRVAAAVVERARTLCALMFYACRYIVTIYLVGKLLCISCRSWCGLRRQGAGRSSSQWVSPLGCFWLGFFCFKIWRWVSVRQLLSVTVSFKVIDFPLALELGIVSKYCCQLHADSSLLRLKSFHLWPQAGLVLCSHGN